MDKVPSARSFLDLSDFARPAARWLVRRLQPTPVTSIHLTLAFTAAGLAAAVLLALDRGLVLAAVLLLLKSGLDAADGALARARHRPSRVGRFLDSICDFVVNLAVYAGIGWGAYARDGRIAVMVLAAVALTASLLQVSVFNHYYVRYRIQTGGDLTSRVAEPEPAGYAWDNPRWLHILLRAYQIIYGWQDAAVEWLDRRLAGQADRRLTPRFMTAVSVLGLGTQLLVLAVCAALGQPLFALWLFATVFSAYALLLMSARRTLRI